MTTRMQEVFSEGSPHKRRNLALIGGAILLSCVAVLVASKWNGKAMEANVLGESVINLHKASTHFPIGLLLASAFLDTGALITGRADLRKAAFWTMVGGTLSCVLTVLFGFLGNPFAGDTGALAAKVALHQKVGIFSTALFGVLTLWRVGRESRFSKIESALFTVATLVAVAMISATGYLGGHLLD